MLRVTTLYASTAGATAEYYARYLSEAPGEVPGRWVGGEVDGFGFSVGDIVEAEQLRLLLEGCDPVSGIRLGRPLTDRRCADGRVVRAVGGFDATFSAPKSLSVLWAITGDQRLLDAHDAAVAAALAHLERFGSTSRVRSYGRRMFPDSGGLSIAVFRQTTSRDDDPQLHTHAVVSAKVRTGDGNWRALDARYLKRHQRMLGGVYQSVLRNELSNRFGVGFGAIDKGQAEIVGVPADVLAQFSKRAREIDAELAGRLDGFRRREGRDPTRGERAAIEREVAGDTRAKKSGMPASSLRARWMAEIATLGHRPGDIVTAVQRAGRVPDVAPRLSSDQVIDALSTSGSSWSRADVMRAVTDLARPVPGLSGADWTRTLERACDRVLAACTDLDPGAGHQSRRSDGRSVWIEPVAAHLTSEHILVEEERIVSWAIDAQFAESSPSSTVAVDGLDVLQGDVARAVAGDDRLVLALGPAGTGKTTTLRAAAVDLGRQRRPVFGVAPSAKAARVLERETGVRADTLAKLLHEWQQPDRPPGADYRLPPGTTVIVDEAGMVGTASMHQLVVLTDANRWRLTLIGDPLQVQAVGRGGMFAELCRTGRSVELQQIHRFTSPWEAAASRELRHGHVAALDAYQAHGRIDAGSIADHLHHIARSWLQTYEAGETCAITVSTNDHVDVVNTVVQAVRVNAGHLDPRRNAVIADGDRAHIGDVVVTRRNERRLTTERGEPVRNRELWTVSRLGSDGSISVSSNAGHGDVALPADYVCQHVQLGYAATEHGNQADTVTVGMVLATRSTTRRGLYVGATRGRDRNEILVVTDQPTSNDARQVLEGILVNDHVDTPAIETRRQLAGATQPQPEASQPRMVPTPRCPIPAFYDELFADAHRRVQTQRRTQAELANAQHASNEAAATLERLTRESAPHRTVLGDAERANSAAEVSERVARRRLNEARIGTRGPLRRKLADAEHARSVTQRRLVAARDEHGPIVAEHAHAHQAAADARRHATAMVTLAGWTDDTDAENTLSLLQRWHDWATGQTVDPDQLTAVRDDLRRLGVTTAGSTYRTLAALIDERTTLPAVDIPVDPPTRTVALDIGL